MSSNSSNSSSIVPQKPSSEGGEGNNISSPTKKQIAPSKRWCFTFNNYDDKTVSSIIPIIDNNCSIGFFSKEVGESGTPHLQGYLEFKNKARPLSFFKDFKIHWSKAKGSKDDNYNYCTKDQKLFFNKGMKIKKEVKLITPDRFYQQYILKILKEEPDDRKIYWFYGEGNIGKTQFSKYCYMKVPGTYVLAGKGADVRNGIADYVEEHNETPNVVLYPIPKSYNNEYLSYESLENIKDMFFYSGKYKGKAICGNSPHLIVFANEPPKLDKLSADRWEVFKIKNNFKLTKKS